MTTATASYRTLAGGEAPIRMFLDDTLQGQVESAVYDQARKAYKDLDDVLAAVQAFGLAAVVARCYPIGSIKG